MGEEAYPGSTKVIQDWCIKELSPMWSINGRNNQCQGHLGTVVHVYTFSVHGASELTEAQSRIAAKRLLDTIPYSVERTESSSRATSSPVSGFASSCMCTRCWWILRLEQSTNWKIVSRASPSLDVPSKITATGTHVVHQFQPWIAFFPHLKQKGWDQTLALFQQDEMNYLPTSFKSYQSCWWLHLPSRKYTKPLHGTPWLPQVEFHLRGENQYHTSARLQQYLSLSSPSLL